MGILRPIPFRQAPATVTTTEETAGVYDPARIEPRWQAHWVEQRTYAARDDRASPKFYVLDMFPYPSGTGLHVGHLLGYFATDIVARFKRHRGFDVLHPMGWDAFGLPAEQYALKTGIHPAVTTRKNVTNFRRQCQAFGLGYDWDREIDTTDPRYYRWTQWIFLKLHERGLAYEAEVPVNWCPALGTVLANEEVVDGRSEVGGHPVVRRPMRQWMLRITAYADRLLEDLELVDWPEHIKAMQRHWIGRSEGAEIDFPVVDARGQPTMLSEGPATLRVFTTRPDTLFGATYMVLAPEHPLVELVTTRAQREQVDEYREQAARKSDLDRTDLAREKTGVFTGAYAVNPATEERIPVWIADYVLMGYGTGAIMAVPGGDQRDWEFATRHGLPIVEVVRGGDVDEGAYEGEGPHVNSGFLDGLGVEEAKAQMIAWLEQHGGGRAAVHTRLRDWLFSRQRYWGEPFPVCHREDGSVVLVPEEELPVTLPEVDRYEPSGTGESPLATIRSWVETTDARTGEPLRRETNTMPQWAGSCWYYLRFLDAENDEALVDPDAERYWMPVDLYVGGAEHAVLHLLYARFWHKVLYDAGVVSTPEPFLRLVNPGMILGEDGEKMSKSRGNTVDPEDFARQYGADTLRLYEMFMGPLTATKPWQTAGAGGCLRFLKRVFRLYVAEDGTLAVEDAPPTAPARSAFHRTLDKVGEDLESLSFNTAIAALMEFVNVLTKEHAGMPRELACDFLVMLEPLAPHLAEELNARLGAGGELAWAAWPEVDADELVRETVEVPVQVNGKLRARIRVAPDADAEALERRARDAVADELARGRVRKVVAVPGRIVNFVVAPA